MMAGVLWGPVPPPVVADTLMEYVRNARSPVKTCDVAAGLAFTLPVCADSPKVPWSFEECRIEKLKSRRMEAREIFIYLFIYLFWDNVAGSRLNCAIWLSHVDR